MKLNHTYFIRRLQLAAERPFSKHVINAVSKSHHVIDMVRPPLLEHTSGKCLQHNHILCFPSTKEQPFTIIIIHITRTLLLKTSS